jgi:hypothetical protein
MKPCCTLFFYALPVYVAIAPAAFSAPTVINDSPTLSTGEKQLLDLAATRNTNVFLDSTDVPRNLKASNITSDRKSNPIVVTALEQHFSALNFSPNTFLFWNEPDSHEIAQAVAQGQGFGAELGTLPLEEVEKQLNDFVEAKGEPDPDTLSYSFKLAELPQALQQQITAHLFAKAAGNETSSDIQVWLNPSTWLKSNIYFVPANPNMTGSWDTLIAGSKLETTTGTRELRIDLRMGGDFTLTEPKEQDEQEADNQAINQDTVLLKDGQARVWPMRNGNGGNQSALIAYPTRKAGSALQTVTTTALTPIPTNDPRLLAPISFKPSRLTLTNFVAQLSQTTKSDLSVSSQVADKNYYLSTTIDTLSAYEAMQAVARLYSLNWVKENDNKYRLDLAHRSELHTKLLRVGYLMWYRFRERNSTIERKNMADFGTLAAQVVDEAGPAILTAPGVPFTSLPLETQAKLRNGVKRGLARFMLTKQLDFLPLLNSEWAFDFNPTARQLKLIENGRPQMLLVFPPPRPTNQ